MSHHPSPVARGSRPEYTDSRTLSLVIVIQVASDFLRRLDTAHHQPAPVQAMDYFHKHQQSPASHRTFSPINHQHPTATYLDYAPTHTGDANCYTSCFERLGFKITASTILKRDMLVNHLKAHLDQSVYRFLRSTDNEAAFIVMVSEFLVEHGEEYWGLSNREHLAEPDVYKGFLYPRDANRGNSELLKALGNLFDYKAKSRVNHMRRINGLAWINDNVDYKAMTGRKADALALSSVKLRPTPKSNKRRPSSVHPHEVHDENENEDMGNYKEPPTGSWTVFDPVEKETRLRPSPSISHQWKGYVSGDESDRPLLVQRSKVKKQRHRMSALDFFLSELITSAETSKEAGHTATGETPVEQESDLEPRLMHKRRRPQPQPQHFTPPTSHAPSATPAVSCPLPVIDLDSSPKRKLPNKQASKDKLPNSNPSEKDTSLKTEINAANIKGEPIFAGHRARTVLRVEASNDDKAPITVPFAAWKTSEQLFSTLIKEQGLRPELGKKVKQISATYAWNKRRHGIRRGREEDWDRFCKTIQKAWELESDKFDDECEIEMVLHVDE